MNLLDIRTTIGESGHVVTLSGEADLTNVTQLDDALNALITSGARHLTIDLSELRFADSASIAALVRASRKLKDQSGHLELTNPQATVARALSLLGLDQALAVHAVPGQEPPLSLSPPPAPPAARGPRGV